MEQQKIMKLLLSTSLVLIYCMCLCAYLAHISGNTVALKNICLVRRDIHILEVEFLFELNLNCTSCIPAIFT
jgi:hypothetical protein